MSDLSPIVKESIRAYMLCFVIPSSVILTIISGLIGFVVSSTVNIQAMSIAEDRINDLFARNESQLDKLMTKSTDQVDKLILKASEATIAAAADAAKTSIIFNQAAAELNEAKSKLSVIVAGVVRCKNSKRGNYETI